MSTLVSFDPKGVFGPAMNLIYNAAYYNGKGLKDITSLAEENFFKLSSIKLEGGNDFCSFVLLMNGLNHSLTPTQIVSTRFFIGMKKRDPSPFHQNVLEFIVPRMFNAVRDQFPQVDQVSDEVKEWAARLVESYMTDDQIKEHCALQGLLPDGEEFKIIGSDLDTAVNTHQFTEQDLDTLLDVSRMALDRLKNTEHFAATLSLLGWYLSSFPIDSDIPVKQLTATDWDFLINISQVSKERLRKSSHFNSTIHFTGRYLTLFSKSNHPLLLGNKALNTLATISRKEMFQKNN
jgi:hypothetical protein